MNGDTINPTPQKPRSMVWVWVALIIALLIVAGLAYYFTSNTSETNNNTVSNTVVNQTTTNTAVNQAVANTNLTLVTNTSATNADTTLTTLDMVEYRSPEFGYTLNYVEQETYTTSSTSNAGQNLYNEWTLYSGDDRLVVVQVFPTDKKDEIFAAKNYAQLDETEELGRKLTANKLTIGGQNKGYTFIRGNYLFIVFSDFVPDADSFSKFTEIAKTLSFSG